MSQPGLFLREARVQPVDQGVPEAGEQRRGWEEDRVGARHQVEDRDVRREIRDRDQGDEARDAVWRLAGEPERHQHVRAHGEHDRPEREAELRAPANERVHPPATPAAVRSARI